MFFDYVIRSLPLQSLGNVFSGERAPSARTYGRSLTR